MLSENDSWKTLGIERRSTKNGCFWPLGDFHQRQFFARPSQYKVIVAVQESVICAIGRIECPRKLAGTSVQPSVLKFGGEASVGDVHSGREDGSNSPIAVRRYRADPTFVIRSIREMVSLRLATAA